MKVKKIQIKPLEESLGDFASAYRKVSQRKFVRKRGGVFFASIGAHVTSAEFRVTNRNFAALRYRDLPNFKTVFFAFFLFLVIGMNTDK